MKNFIKQKLKNKFILLVLGIITLVIGFQWYMADDLADVDTKSYVVLVKGKVNINDYLLKKGERKKLSVGDIITTKQNSACVIEWGDGSLTRLGENGKIEIQELNVEKDLSKINLQFKLTKGKTWSNVVSFLGENSYFKQNFQDIEASVRGTIFDVNLDRDYVYVANHEVKVKKGDKQKIVSENKALSISNFSFIDIKKFISEIQDKVWENINKEFDQKFFDNLKKDISESIDLDNINQIIKENSDYKKLLSEYQKFNFVSPEDTELFKIKNELRKSLIEKADSENKENLVKYSVFDLEDAIKSKNIDGIKETISILGENKDILKNMNINFDKDIFNDLNQIGDSVKKSIKDLDFNIDDMNFDDFKDKTNILKDAAKDKINELKDNFNINF